jgi:hypothetical protein
MMPESASSSTPSSTDSPPADGAPASNTPDPAPRENGGRGGLDPTRYGDWEKNGRCIDF